MTATVDNAVADLQRANAELQRQLDERTAERDEALQRETATAEVLGVINSSPGDLAPVFDSILEKAHTLCGAALGSLVLYDGENLRAGATRGYPEEYARLARQGGPAHSVSSFERLLRGERLVHLPDLAAFEAPNPLTRAAVEIAGIRTVLMVSLRKDGALLGYISAQRQEVRPFSDKEIALLENFAAQAVIAMENARLITETREALEQQTATAEVLGVINSSPSELSPVFDAMLDKALRLCGATYGGLATFDGECFHPVAGRGHPAYDAWLRQQGPIRPAPGSTIARIVAGEDAVQITDIANDEVYRAGAPGRRALVDIGGFRTLLGIALRKDNTLLGTLQVYRQEIHPFTGKQIALLQNFAAQAVIAMENTRLFGELRQRTDDLQESLEYQTATSDVLKVISRSTFDLQPVLQTVVETAVRICGAEAGNIFRRETDGYSFAASFGWLPEHQEFQAKFIGNRRLVLGENRGSIVGRVALEEGIVHVHDVASDPDYARAEAVIAKLRTALGVPLLREGLLIGVITLGRLRVEPFTERQIELVRTFADQAVIAIENTRLLTETREALDQQTATAEVLQVINSSPGDLAPVFEAMLEKAMRLCEAAIGIMFSVEGASARIVAERDVPKEFSNYLAQQAPDIGPDTFFGRAVLERSILHTTDITAEEAYRQRTALSVAAVDLAGIRALLMAPLVKDNAVLGIFAIFRREARPFSDKQIALLQNFASQAVIAMENARLLRELQQRTGDLQETLEYQTATSDVLKVISQSTFDLDPVLQTVVETAVRICDADKGAISLLRPDGLYHPTAPVGFGQEYEAVIRHTAFAADRGSLTGRVAVEGRVVHITDALADPEFTALETQRAGDMRTMLGVPLLRSDSVIGVLGVMRGRVQPFTEKQIVLFRTFADQAVIAIENARLLNELRERTEEVAGWNRELEVRVAAQLAELERTGKLRRFLAPQLADLIVAQGDESILESHRREIVVVFCDLRGFTGFAERAEPEEVMALLRDYHAAMGPIVASFEGTLDHYAGDGIMVFFNDPLPTPDPAKRAIDMALAMREAAQGLLRTWRRHGHDLGFGVGISQGYATLGQIGFAERMDYTAIGTVTNLAARLCSEAKDGQILISRRVATTVEDSATLEEIGDLSLKGLSQAVAVYNVVAVGATASAS